LNQFFGNYRGEVIRTDDPLKAGRVKVNIFGVYDGFKEEDIPWAIYADSFMGGSTKAGGIIVPEVGAHIWCFFEGGNHHYPVYWAGAPAMKDKTPDIPAESSAKENQYPFNKVFKTGAGFVVEVDDMAGDTRFRFYQPSGNELIVDHGGNVQETVVGTTEQTKTGDVTENYEANHTTNTGGNKTEDVAGDITITSGGTITIDSGGSTITISNGGDIEIVSAGQVNVTGVMINLN